MIEMFIVDQIHQVVSCEGGGVEARSEWGDSSKLAWRHGNQDDCVEVLSNVAISFNCSAAQEIGRGRFLDEEFPININSKYEWKLLDFQPNLLATQELNFVNFQQQEISLRCHALSLICWRAQFIYLYVYFQYNFRALETRKKVFPFFLFRRQRSH